MSRAHRAPLDPDTLDRLRRSTGLTVDREGWLRHEGERFRNRRLARRLQALLRWDAGRKALVLDIGGQWAYVGWEDAPFVIENVELADGAGRSVVVMRLSDTTHERLDPATLWHVAGTALYARVKGALAAARFGRDAWHKLAAYFEEAAPDDDGGSGGSSGAASLVLVLPDGTRWTVPPGSPPEPAAPVQVT